MVYLIAFVLIGALCAGVSIFAARAGRVPALIVAWLFLAAVLGGVGYWDWNAQSTKDTAIGFYLVTAVVTPIVALVVAWFGRRESLLIQGFAIGLSVFFTIIGLDVIAFMAGF